MQYNFKTSGTCSRSVQIDVDDDGIINSVEFMGGCQGNLKGISALVTGEKVGDVIDKLKGLTCGGKDTSCPDQLSKALEKMKGDIN